MAGKPSKNSRVVRREASTEAPKKKPTHWLFPYKPGKPTKPCGSYCSEEEAKAAQKHFNFPTTIWAGWGT